VAHPPGTMLSGSYNGSGWKGHNLYWLKSQKPELFTFKLPDKADASGQGKDALAPGFQKYCEGWHFNPQSEEFVDVEGGRRFALDRGSAQYYRVHEGTTWETELSILADASVFNGTAMAPRCRKVLIADLHRAAAALKLDVSHLDRPAAVFAVFDGGGPEAQPAENAAKGFHVQLLPRLASFRGEWSPDDLKAALSTSLGISCEASAAAPASAAAALLLGPCLTVAAAGPGARCLLCARRQQTAGPSLLAVHGSAHGRHVRDLARPVLIVAGDEDGGSGSSSGGGAPGPSPGTPNPPAPPKELPLALRLAAAGDRAGKPNANGRPAPGPQGLEAAAGSQPSGIASAFFDLDFGGRFQSLTLVAGPTPSLAGLSDQDVADLAEPMAVRRRPRASSRILVQAARAHNAEDSLIVGNVNFVWASSSPVDVGAAPSSAKRARTDAHDKVRVRHILLRHTGCPASHDNTRHRKVARSMEEAEDLLLAVMAELDRDPTQFTSKCREISECQTSLKGGELAGDLGWLSRERPRSGQPEVHKAAFSLGVGQLSDLIVSKDGIHVLLRTA